MSSDVDRKSVRFRCLKSQSVKLIRAQDRSSAPNENANYVLQRIKDSADMCNRIIITTYQFLRLYMLNRYERHKHLYVDEQLIRVIMGVIAPPKVRCGPQTTCSDANDVKQFYDDHFRQLIGDGSYNANISITGLTNVLEYSTVGIITAYKNNIVIHFPSHIKKAIYANFVFDKHTRKDVYKIFKDLVNGVFCGDTVDIDQQNWIVANASSMKSMTDTQKIEKIKTDLSLSDNSCIIEQIVKIQGNLRNTLEKIDEFSKLDKKTKKNTLSDVNGSNNISSTTKKKIDVLLKNLNYDLNVDKIWILKFAYETKATIRKKIGKDYKICDDRSIISCIYNDVVNYIKFIDEPVVLESDAKYHDWIMSNRSRILPMFFRKSFYYEITTNPFKFLQYMITINLDLESGDRKLFQPLPMRKSLSPRHIYIDTACLVDIIGDLSSYYTYLKDNGHNFTKSAVKQNINKIKDLTWQYLFVGLYSHKNRNLLGSTSVDKDKFCFNYAISTDGIAVSVVQVPFSQRGKSDRGSSRSTKNEDKTPYLEDLSNEKLEELREFKLCGVDPGKKSIVTIIDENDNKLSYTSIQRRREGRMTRSLRIRRNLRTTEMDEEESKLSEHNSKSCIFDNSKEYIRCKQDVNNKLYDHYLNEKYRKLRLDKYIHTRRSEDKLVEKIMKTYGSEEDLDKRREQLMNGKYPEKAKIALIYGNWNQTKQMRNLFPTPGIGMRRMLERHFHVYLVDEYKTSKLCSRCETETENMRVGELCEKNGRVSLSEEKLHSLLRCKNEDCGKVCNRDTNGSKNIVKIGRVYIEEQRRPENFCRKQKQIVSL